MQIADLILPVFAVILTGWIVAYTGYLSRALSDALIHFAYNIAMPALLIVTFAQEPSHSLINWRLPHLHMHFFPRYRGDQFEGQPINPRLVKNPVYSPGEFQRIRDAFLAALSSNHA